MVFLVVVQVLVEILPQLDGDEFGVVFGDVLVVDHLKCSTFRVIFVVEVVDGFGHLLFGTAAVSQAESALFAAVRLGDVLQSTEQRVLLVTAETGDEVASLGEHVKQVEDAENDLEVGRQQQLRQVLNRIVEMPREAVFN